MQPRFNNHVSTKPFAAACSWSGGKDSCYALMAAIRSGAIPGVLINMMNENGKVSRSHGLPVQVLEQQANAIGIPLIAVPTSWKDYERHFVDALQEARSLYATEAMVFGDIDLQAHRDWEEMVCATAGITAILPLWQRHRKLLLLEMLANGIESVIVSCNATLGESFLGRRLDHAIIPELEARSVDVCGENGEFHTLVVNCPLFKQRIRIPEFEKIMHENYFFCDWKPGMTTLSDDDLEARPRP